MASVVAKTTFKSKKVRRGKRKRKVKHNVNSEHIDNKWSIFHLNIRGYNSKKTNFDAIIGQVKPNVITLNETGLRKKKKISISNYESFTRNRKNGKIMGGIATAVMNEEKDCILQTKEGTGNDEFIVTRHGQFLTPINIFNIYGEQESRENKNEIENRWSRIMEEVIRAEKRNEAVVIIGDLNNHIGNDDLGVKDNIPKVSFGGELVRALLQGGNYCCLNNHQNTVGGPFTRYDPAYPDDPNKMSCLDLVIVSVNLLPYFKSLVIDKEKKFSPVRPVSRGSNVYSDHFPVIVTFENIPKRKVEKPPRQKQTIWNTNKEGGWELFENLTDDVFTFGNCVDKVDGASTSDDYKQILKQIEKVKYSAFGKVKIKTGQTDKKLENLLKIQQSNPTSEVKEKVSERILELQREDFEKELNDIMVLKKEKGKSAAVFRTLEKISGNKRSSHGQVCMVDPSTKLPMFDPENIKSAAAFYVKDLLQNQFYSNDYERFYYLQEMIHYVRCNDVESNEILTNKAFEGRLDLISKKCPEKYKFIIHSGEAFKNCIFKLFEKVWTLESKPDQWKDTVVVQLYKGKGEPSEFSNQRNIHTKEAIPKLFEGIIVDLSKEKLIQSCSKFQIGGIPGHRPQEHLFTVKSVISLYMYLKLPLYLQLYDISTYFDKEILRDAMDTLFSAGITGKLYRLWFLMNSSAKVKVKTEFGLTESIDTGENVTQGSIGGAILSALNLDKTVTAHFANSDTNVSYGPVLLSPLLYQDDSAKFSTGLNHAQKSNLLMSKVMEMKKLQMNVSKCGTMFFGKKKEVDTKKLEIEESKCLTINDNPVPFKITEKYLGDFFHCEGLNKSAETTVNKRFGLALNSVVELKCVIEDFRMHKLGGIRCGLEIFNMAILPALLYNSETWLEIADSTVERLDRLQLILLRSLFAVPSSTPIPALSWDSGQLSMKHKINEKS